MHHRKERKKLSRDKDHVNSLERNLITNLIIYGKIKTTSKKAKFIQPKIERVISKVKQYDTVNAIRYLNKIVTIENASRKMMEVYKPKYKDKKSGFTQIYKIGYRQGDNAEIVQIKLI